MPDREVELTKLLEIADARLVERIVVAEEISLAHVALSETVEDRFRDALGPVADSLDNRLSLLRELVRVRPVLEGKLASRRENAAVGRDFECLGHRRIQLRRLCLVTLETRFAADVANAVRLQVRTPIGKDVLALSVAEDAHQEADHANAGNSISKRGLHLRQPSRNGSRAGLSVYQSCRSANVSRLSLS